MKKSKYLSDEEVEAEIARLRNDPDVALARLNDRVKYKRRQALYTLRNLQKRGQALRENGITAEMIITSDDN